LQVNEGRKGHLPENERVVRSPLKKGSSSQVKLSEQQECAADVQKLCSKLTGTSNFAIIDCLQNDNLASV